MFNPFGIGLGGWKPPPLRMLDDGDSGLRRVAPYPGLMQFRPAGALGSAPALQPHKKRLAIKPRYYGE